MRRAWGGVAAPGALRSRGAPDGREARPGPTIVTRQAVGVIQRRTDDGDGGGRNIGCYQAVTGMPVLHRRWFCVGQGRCSSTVSARGNTLMRE